MTQTESYRGSYFAFLNIYSKDSSTFQKVGYITEDVFPKLCDGRFVFSPFLCTAPNKLHLRHVMCLSYTEFKSVQKKVQLFSWLSPLTTDFPSLCI